MSPQDLPARWFSLAGGLEGLAALLALGGFLAVVQTFVIGQHFVIPTMVLVPTIFFAVLATAGARGERWAQGVLLWLGALAVAHLFFALFWAKTPRALLGSAFLPVYGAALVLMAGLTRAYHRANSLYFFFPRAPEP